MRWAGGYGYDHVSHGHTRVYAPGLSVAGIAQLNGHPGLERSMDCVAQWTHATSGMFRDAESPAFCATQHTVITRHGGSTERYANAVSNGRASMKIALLWISPCFS
jgi:hypothetical protein